MHKFLPTIKELNTCIAECRRCSRLVHFRENVPEKKQFAGQTYWKKPVPGFGDPNAYLLILGLAPSAQGGNRTGRIFTGDESARFLFKALYEEGFASKPTSDGLHDGTELIGCYLTAAVKCVPPDNKPNAIEQKNCSPFLENEFFLLKNLTSVLALGGFAFQAYLQYIKTHGGPKAAHRFAHGKNVQQGPERCRGAPEITSPRGEDFFFAKPAVSGYRHALFELL